MIMQLGISTYTYTWGFGVPGMIPESPLDHFILIDKASKYALKVVQIADNAGLQMFTHSETESLRKYAEGKGIRIEVGTRGLRSANIEAHLVIASLVKSDILRIVLDEPGFEPSVSEAITTIREFLPELRKRKIRLAIENHDRLKCREFVEIVKATDPDWVGICLDSVNSMGAGEGLEEVIRALSPFTINLHLKEFIIRRPEHKMGFIVEGCPAGNGMLNIPELLNSINHYGKCRSAILELWTPPAESLQETINREAEWAEKSISYLKKYF